MKKFNDFKNSPADKKTIGMVLGFAYGLSLGTIIGIVTKELLIWNIVFAMLGMSIGLVVSTNKK